VVCPWETVIIRLNWPMDKLVNTSRLYIRAFMLVGQCRGIRASLITLNPKPDHCPF